MLAGQLKFLVSHMKSLKRYWYYSPIVVLADVPCVMAAIGGSCCFTILRVASQVGQPEYPG